ncbi:MULTISPECIES: DinB family protein [Paenibacillus]|uniref:DinB family protein n=1 Tax=Paenibacillus cucumis (ex Kampfer et al. 2016) TaxID=1776858 RepID=A0ABS7KLW7_9BACL|nr:MULTISPECIES: DinB family protein [Paenibacillus]MBY0204911.1 DinB family protein [Paenibacillus cucumis (ex Kampfer et al. 2016)]
MKTVTTALDVLVIQNEDTWDQCNWIVPLSKALEGLNAEQAAWVPPSGGLSIWQLANHMFYYNQRILERLQEKEPSVPAADSNVATFGISGDPLNEAGWSKLMEQTTKLAEQLRDTLATLQDSKLEEAYMDSDDNWAQTLARWVLHDAYHAGQIVQLRRQQGCWSIVF